MKYAFMSFSTPELTLAETLTLAARIGYAGIEPRTGRNHAHGVEAERTPNERREILKLSQEYGVEICCLALGTKFSDPALSTSAHDECLKYLDLASALDCQRLRVFGGVFPEEISREKAIDTMAERLAHIAPAARSANVKICIETHDAWTLPEHVAEVLRRVDHPNIGVNWDIMHPYRTSHKSMRKAFESLRPWIYHVHTHDGTMADPLVLKPTGQGEIDIPEAITCLVENNYDGFISGEWIDAPIDLEEELNRLVELENSIRHESAKR